MIVLVEKREIKVYYIPSEKMIAYPMTTGMSLETFVRYVEKMGLRYIT